MACPVLFGCWGPVAADSLGKIIIHRLYNDHMMMTLTLLLLLLLPWMTLAVAALPQSAHELITVH